MKILFLARRFYPDIGGVEKHVLEVSKRLVAMGNTVTIVSESPNFKTTTVDNPFKLNIIKIPIGKTEKKKKFLIWKWLWKHRKLIQDADIIHAHDVFYWY